jgi:hypothetical protein
MMSDQPINHLDSNMMLADDALLTKPQTGTARGTVWRWPL